MPRSSSVSEKVWAQAIHAVTVQKMSLRRAAQLYGVHHMSLHRRVRGRYMGNATACYANEFQLTPVEEDEIVSVLREQFVHEHQVTSDDVRYVVRTIVCQNGRRDIPSDFPQNRWIATFKHRHSFLTEPFSPREPLPMRYEAASPDFSLSSGSGSSSFAQSNQGVSPTMYNSSSNSVEPSISQMGNSMSGSSLYAGSSPYASASALHRGDSMSTEDGDQMDDTSESESEHHCESLKRGDRHVADEKRCRQSSTVSAETWEKAMDAVEIHGMSLRNAAKAYGVHFAALHRRVKKRALKKEAAPPLENYIPFEDEAGIVRVIHARADLGILMTYEELVDLLNHTALKYASVVTIELSRSLIRRFQSRVEHSIRHLIRDWPLPRLDTLCRFGVAEEKVSSPPSLPALVSPRSLRQPHLQQHRHQQTIPSLYVVNLESSTLDPNRSSLSDPFPLYREESTALLPPPPPPATALCLPDHQTSSPHSLTASVLRL